MRTVLMLMSVLSVFQNVEARPNREVGSPIGTISKSALSADKSTLVGVNEATKTLDILDMNSQKMVRSFELDGFVDQPLEGSRTYINHIELNEQGDVILVEAQQLKQRDYPVVGAVVSVENVVLNLFHRKLAKTIQLKFNGLLRGVSLSSSGKTLTVVPESSVIKFFPNHVLVIDLEKIFNDLSSMAAYDSVEVVRLDKNDLKSYLRYKKDEWVVGDTPYQKFLPRLQCPKGECTVLNTNSKTYAFYTDFTEKIELSPDLMKELTGSSEPE